MVGLSLAAMLLVVAAQAEVGAGKACGDAELLVHTRHQDAVHAEGTEGQLKDLTREYAGLRASHGDEPRYQYLFARTLIGRETPRAIALLTALAQFAPAWQALAEIYGSAAFHDPVKEKEARARFLEACPGGTIRKLPIAPPAPSGFFDHPIERLDDPRLPEQILAALHHDDERLQRFRPFDWYPPDTKRQQIRELQLEYWSGWWVLARHYLKTGQRAKADALLAEMQQRFDHLKIDPHDIAFWAAGEKLLTLYLDDRQPGRARAILADLRTRAEGAEHAARLKELEAAAARAGER